MPCSIETIMFRQPIFTLDGIQMLEPLHLAAFCIFWVRNYIKRFATGRNDLLVGLTENSGCRIGVINLHRTSRAVSDQMDFLCCLFSAAIRLQTGGDDAEGNSVPGCDVILVAGDINIKNIYYGRGISLDVDAGDFPDCNKRMIALCYYMLLTGLVPAPFVDKKRDYEIDILLTSKNLIKHSDFVLQLEEGNPSDHEFFGAVF